MTLHDARIVNSSGADPAHGDHVTVQRSVSDIPTGDSLSKAWLTIKRLKNQEDADALLQLEVNSTPSNDGQITDTGTGDTAGAVKFVISDTDYDDLPADIELVYDIQLLTVAGVRSTLEIGTVTFARDITRALS